MTTKPVSRLGRGLASLIPDSALDGTDTSPKAVLRTVPIDEISPNPEQPRHVFAEEDLASLADSIRQHGILNPLVVRRAEGRYILIAGERRFRAAARAGLSEVPVVVREAVSAREQLELALVENLQRADLDAIEAARGYARLADDFKLTQEEIATKVGKDRATVSNAIRLLKLPQYVLDALRENRISAGHARALLPLSDAPDDMRRALAKVLSSRLNVRATESLVAELTSAPKRLRDAVRERRDRTFEVATKMLRESLHTDVAIKPLKKGGGSIVIAYSNAEELERLIQRMRQVAAK